MGKKVLIVCYYWPPAGGPGVQRWLKFVKYLPEFGYEPIVYVPENASYPINDESLLTEVPETITILKRPIKEPYRWANMLSRKQTKTISSGILPKEGNQSLLQKMLLYIRGNFFIPDARVSWVRPSINYLKTYIEAEEIDTIITTGPPHSLHLIGQRLQKQCYIGETEKNLRWIADFRDPWTTIGYHDKLKMSRRTQEKHKALEQSVLHCADAVLVTSPTTKTDFESLTDKKVHLITNGYDDVTITQEIEIDTRFTISHIGSLLSDRNPLVLWEVLKELSQELEGFSQSLTIQLVGKVSEDVLASIKENELNANVELKGYVAHSEALVLQRKAQVLLLVEIDSASTKAIIPGKVFEYLNAQRPILAIGPQDADMKDIITQTGGGSYFEYAEKLALKTHMKQLYDSYQKGDLTAQKSTIHEYHRKALTDKLVTILNS